MYCRISIGASVCGFSFQNKRNASLASLHSAVRTGMKNIVSCHVNFESSSLSKIDKISPTKKKLDNKKIIPLIKGSPRQVSVNDHMIVSERVYLFFLLEIPKVREPLQRPLLIHHNRLLGFHFKFLVFARMNLLSICVLLLGNVCRCAVASL